MSKHQKTDTGVVEIKPEKIVRMCECFFQDWLKLKNENLGLLQRLFEGDKEAEVEVKEFISAETEFEVSVEGSFFREVEKNVEFVRICQKCLEKY